MSCGHSHSLMFAEVATLQAESTIVLTGIRDLSVRISALPPLIQEFRDKVAAATYLAPSRPTNVTDNIARTSSTSASCCGSRAIKVPQ